METVQAQRQHIPSAILPLLRPSFPSHPIRQLQVKMILCSVDTVSVDADGSTVVYTYVWTDDSGTIQQTTTETTATSDIFLASGTSAGTWMCEVTPYDLSDYGDSDSAEVTIAQGGDIDFDGDGFYDYEDCDDTDASLNYSDVDGDGVSTCDGDCDDTDSSRSPNLTESCDGVDNDCDGSIPSNEFDGDGNGTIDCFRWMVYNRIQRQRF